MKIKEITETFKVTQNSPSGIELTAADGTKMIIPPEKASAFQASETDPNKFVMNQQAMTPASNTPTEPPGPKIGSEVDIPMTTTETQEDDEFADTMDATNQPIGGDPTDDFINDVVDHKWEKSARHNIAVEGDVDPEFFNWEDEPNSVVYGGAGLNSKDPAVKTWNFGSMDDATRRKYQIASFQKQNPGVPLPKELGGPGMPSNESKELTDIKKLSGL